MNSTIQTKVIKGEDLSHGDRKTIDAFGSDYGGFGFEPGGGYVDRAWAENMAIFYGQGLNSVDSNALNLDDNHVDQETSPH